MPGAIKNRMVSPLEIEAANLIGTYAEVYAFDGDPNGALQAPAGSILTRTDATSMLMCVGGSTWVEIAGPGSAQGYTVVVFRPGGVPADNVYTTWATAWAAIDLLEGFRTLVIDDSLAAAEADPGTYDASGVTIAGANVDSMGFPRVLIVPDGTLFNNLQGLHYINISSTSTSQVLDFTRPTEITMTGVVTLTNGGTAPVLDLTGAPAILVTVKSASSLTLVNDAGDPTVRATSGNIVFQLSGSLEWTDKVNPALEITAGRTVQLQVIATQTTMNGLAEGAGDITFNYTNPISVTGQTQPGITGVVTVNDLNSGSLSYEAAIIGDWAGTNPASISNALDRIAAAVGPIPA